MYPIPYKSCPACHGRVPGTTRFCGSCGADLSSVDCQTGDPYVGLHVADKYLLEELIGEGASGRVYRAKQLPLGKAFAIKILAPHLMHDEASHARFANEAHNAASLNHPNCVSIVDYGSTPDGITYIVMEYIAGISLEDVITDQFPLQRERITDLTLQILAALTEAHGLGILHRDLKPENIIIQQLRTHGELAVILDFGIAKLMDTPGGAPSITSAGMVCGTPEYMSPEQARGRALDARSDLYAVGAIMYQMLVGRPPFTGASAIDILHKHLNEEPTPPSIILGLSPDPLEAVCLRALAKDPSQRFSSALEFRDELIAANSFGRAVSSHRCHHCHSDMRADHRFCPQCGVPAPERRGTTPRKRHASRGSGKTASRTGEISTDVLVRSFPLPLLDRSHAIERLRSALQRPTPGTRVHVLTGDPGTGKTRLADEFCSLADHLGWRTHYVGADPSGARTPLWPIRTMVGQLLEVDPHHCNTHELGRVANLCGLGFEELPGLAELFSLDGPARELEPAVRRRECFASAIQALISGGRGQPLLLVFDDIDNFDNASREVLRRLAVAPAPTAVLIIATSADPEVRWLGGFVDHLEHLSHGAVRQAANEILGETRLQSSVIEQLANDVPMSPLRLEQNLRLLLEGIQIDPGIHTQALIRMRLSTVEPALTELLELASVLGERQLEEDLANLYQHEYGTVGPAFDDALMQLHVAGLLLVVGAGQRAFAHQFIHEVVYDGIPEPRRQQLHGVAATTSRIARRQPATRAIHLARAGLDGQNLAHALREAATAAEAAFDYPLAAEFLTATMTQCGAISDKEAARGLEIEAAVATTRIMISDEFADQSIAMLEQLAGSNLAPQHHVSVLAALGKQLRRRDRLDAAEDTLRRALGPAIALGDPRSLLDIYRDLGKVLVRRGHHAEALDELREGLDLATAGEGPRADIDLELWRYLFELCEVERGARRPAQAREWCELALFQAERHGDRVGLLRCYAQMAWVLRELKQDALGEQYLGRALEEARHFGDRLTTAELLIERARARAARGRIAEAQRCCEEALRLAEGLQWTTGIDHAHRALSLLRRQTPAFTDPSPDVSGAFARPTPVDLASHPPADDP